MQTPPILIRSALAGACIASALAAGCSSTPVPKEQLAVGQSSIDAAQSAGAGELAPVELNRAREKLAKANQAAKEKQNDIARRLAEEASADAQVARTKASAEKSRRAADEVAASIQTLRQQLNPSNDSGLMPTAPAAGVQRNPQGGGQPPSRIDPANQR